MMCVHACECVCVPDIKCCNFDTPSMKCAPANGKLVILMYVSCYIVHKYKITRVTRAYYMIFTTVTRTLNRQRGVARVRRCSWRLPSTWGMALASRLVQLTVLHGTCTGYGRSGLLALGSSLLVTEWVFD